MHFNVWIKWRIEIEMFESFGNPFDVLAQVCAQQLRIRSRQPASAIPSQDVDPFRSGAVRATRSGRSG